MGKRNKKRKHNQNQQNHRQQQKKRKKQRTNTERFWIQDCQDLVSIDGTATSPDILLWISLALLEDSHHSNISKKIIKEEKSKDNPKIFEMERPSGATFQKPDSEALGHNENNMNDHDNSNGTTEPIIYIQRSAAQKEPRKLHYQNSYKQYVPLPNGDCGDGIINPHKDVPDKYWAQRHRLLSKFDQGIQLDKEGWYSITPEVIANHIAKRIVSANSNGTTTTSASDLVVLDAFCGAGGNSIAFAQRPEVKLTICVDNSLDRLRMAANNCKVYGIPEEKVLFVHGDACQVLKSYKKGKLIITKSEKVANKNIVSDSNLIGKKEVHDKSSTFDNGYSIVSYDSLPNRLDAIFLSPPWGGVEYAEIGPRHYSLSCMKLNDDVQSNDCASTTTMIDGVGILRMTLRALHPKRLNISYFLPRNLNGLTLAKDCFDCGIRGCIEMEEHRLNQKVKTIAVYIQTQSEK